MSEKLPAIIVGALPSPKRVQQEYIHRVKHTHFTPDGKIVECTCGWQSHLCSNDEDYETEWLEHLGG
jgi:hypothetical protein